MIGVDFPDRTAHQIQRPVVYSMRNLINDLCLYVNVTLRLGTFM